MDSGNEVVQDRTETNRASAASNPIAGSTPTAWTQTFQYDGFGNLTAKVLNSTNMPIPVNAATNQVSNASYDANGNMTSGAGATLVYDEANRLSSAAETSGGTEYYYYAPDNKRIYRLNVNGSTSTEEWTFYGARGERLGVYSMGASGFTPLRTDVTFAGQLILNANNPVFNDRTGTNRASGARFYPYGDEITSTSNDREKFATYTRDSYTGLDYADQRFYA
jgi:YD repeat-containing protein